jgi:hypothetical protein
MPAARWVVCPTAIVVHAEVAADGTPDDLSRVEADPDLDIVSL